MPRRGRSRLLTAVGAVVLVSVTALSIYAAVARVVAPDVRHERVAHVHGVAVSGRRLLAATHSGIVDVGHGLHLVGVARRDYEAIVAADGSLYVARHASATDVREQGVGRRDDGLIRSSDGGRTWTAVKLPHRADVHAIAVAGTIYAVDVLDGRLLVSTDGTTWAERDGVGRVADLAVSPLDADLLLATGTDGLRRSADGGRSWRSVAAPTFVAVEWGRAGAWGTTRSGEVWRSGDGNAWARRGRVPGRAGALVVTDEGLTSVVDETRIYTSADGRTWKAVYTG